MKNWLIEITASYSRGSEYKHITVYARDEDHAREMGDKAAEIMTGDSGVVPEHWVSCVSALE